MIPNQRTSPRKQPRQRRAQATVDAILQATARILVRDGYDRTNTNRVAEEAGVSIGSLYQYFPSKEALVSALVDEHIEKQMQLLAENVTALRDAPLEIAVRTYVAAQLEAHALEPELHRVFVEQLPRIEGFERLREMNQQAQALVSAYLASRRAHVRPRDLDVAAFLLVHAVEAATHALILEQPALLRSPQMIDEITELVVRYLRKD